MSEDERYRQLALFSVIVAEVVITPVGLGGLVYTLTKHSQGRVWYSLMAAILGLIIAFYRISLLVKKKS